jgi:hypothetical protein
MVVPVVVLMDIIVGRPELVINLVILVQHLTVVMVGLVVVTDPMLVEEVVALEAMPLRVAVVVLVAEVLVDNLLSGVRGEQTQAIMRELPVLVLARDTLLVAEVVLLIQVMLEVVLLLVVLVAVVVVVKVLQHLLLDILVQEVEVVAQVIIHRLQVGQSNLEVQVL